MVSDDRDNKGRFAPGWRGGPGRPSKQVEAAYARVSFKECPPKKWRLIVRRAVKDALRGSPAARNFLARQLGLGRINVSLETEDGLETLRAAMGALSDAQMQELRQVVAAAKQMTPAERAQLVKELDKRIRRRK